MRRWVVISVGVALGVLGAATVLAVRATSGSPSGSAAIVPSRQPVASWVTDGEIHDVAQAGGKVFAAGTFTRVTSWTGGFARTDSSSGAVIDGTPPIDGDVSVIVADGSGGWYVGGAFDRSDGGACPNLVHVNRAGRIDPRFCARVDRVLAVALAGGRLYVASDCCADVSDSVIAVDPGTGAAVDWTLNVEGGYDDSADQDRNTLGPGIHALASDGDTLFVGGFFDELGGELRTHLAALDGRTGAVRSWNPNIASAGDASSPTDNASDDDLPYPQAYVGALVVHEGLIYAGGAFDEVDGEQRSSVAAFDRGTGALTDWAPTDRALNGGVEALAVNKSNVAVAAGRFLDGQKILYFSAASTRPQPTWAVPVDYRVGDPSYPQVNALEFDRNGSLVAVGDFSHIGRVARSHAAMLRPDGRVTAWDPAPTGEVAAVAIDRADVVLGGAFAGIGGTLRDGLIGFDATTGALLPWAPLVDEVRYQDDADAGNALSYRIAATDERLFVIGDFTRIDGERRNRLAAFELADLSLAPWHPEVVRGDVVFGPYIAAVDESAFVGYWSWEGPSVYDREVRNKLFALDDTGAIEWEAPPTWNVDGEDAVLIDGQLWIGSFDAPYLIALDARSGEIEEGEMPVFDDSVESLSTDGELLYAAGGFANVDGEARPGIAALKGAQLQEWAPALNGEFDVELESVAVTGSHVYLSGDFESIGLVSRPGLGAVTSDTADPIAWPSARVELSGVVTAGPQAVVVAGSYRGSPAGAISVFPLQPSH